MLWLDRIEHALSTARLECTSLGDPEAGSGSGSIVFFAEYKKVQCGTERLKRMKSRRLGCTGGSPDSDEVAQHPAAYLLVCDNGQRSFRALLRRIFEIDQHPVTSVSSARQQSEF